MRNLFITAGHRGKNSGANYNGFHEAEETIWLRDNICAKLVKLGIEPKTDKDEAPLRDVINAVNKTCEPQDILVDLHFNSAGSPSAHGTEVFIPMAKTDTEIEVAEDLLTETCRVLGTKNRGLKREGQGQYNRLAVLSDTRCNSVLLEVCFISNDNDRNTYEQKREELVNALVGVLTKHAKE